ncbi:hypothetical protein ACHAQK_009556 [Fusarium lateritium]
MAWASYPPLPEQVASGENSDFNIACDGQVYKLHQAIVCPQSRVITAACSAMQGGALKTMHIRDRIQERIQDLSTAPDFSRLDVDKRIFLEIIKSCGQRMHFLEHALDITKEMYLRLARELDDE